MRIKTYIQLRKEQNEKISLCKDICNIYKLNHNENLIVWFINSFPNHDINEYFHEWVYRYEKGTEYFISRMDNERKEIFKKVFLK